MRTAEQRQAAAGKFFIKWVAIAAAILFFGSWALSAYQERAQRLGRPDLQPKALHACQPSREKVSEEWRRGRVIMDVKCDDFGGMYILTAPRK